MMTVFPHRKRALTAAAGVLALGALAACGDDGGNGEAGGDGEGGGLLAQLQEEGSVTVGFAGEAPYSFEQDGELTGATVELHRAIFSELGIDNVEGEQTDFSSLIPGLNAERFDVVSAGMSILPDRCEQASFSEPEFMYTTALMVEEGNPNNLSTIDDVADAGDVQLATMTGAIESSYAESLGIDNIEVAGPQDGMDTVTQGRADVFALTGISLNWMADNNPDANVEVTESFVQEIDGEPQVGAGGTVFRDENTELLEAYNEELEAIVSDEERYLEITGPFGFTAEERPTGDLTAEDLCAGDLSGGDDGDDEGDETGDGDDATEDE